MSQEKTYASPFSRFVDLSDLTQAGMEIEIAADADACEKIAAWAEIRAVRAFLAKVALRKLSSTRFRLKADWTAEVEQTCVVTLEPVASHLSGAFERELYYAPGRREDGGELTLAAGDDETPDTIDDLDYDTVAPLLEEFSLNLEAYPRKSGVQFQPPEIAGAEAENPFAVLKSLTKKG
jgi:hypothetical protein